jgi:preprotein translocase subunit SecA
MRRRAADDVLQRCRAVVAEVGALEAEMRARSDADLRALTDAYRTRLADGEALDRLAPEAFATVREAARRALGLRHHDVQILGSAALALPAIALMKSGEGKTLTCVLAAYLHALTGGGVHVASLSDYLARRDAAWMEPIYRLLGMDVGVIGPDMTPQDRRVAYDADVTYGTVNEFGFDHLRDNVAWEADECVQRGRVCAIVDGAEFTLVEEGRTPLIITGEAEDEDSRWVTEFAGIAAELRPGDYEVDERGRAVTISEEGIRRIEDRLGIDNLYDSANSYLLEFLDNALKAKELYLGGRDYIVEDDQVVIIDERTGRTIPDRRYAELLHQALEAKEGVPVRADRQSLAVVTVHGYLTEYDTVAGVAVAAAAELREVYRQCYGLDVVEIPTHRPIIRIDHPDAIHPTEQDQLAAVVAEIAERHAGGQPVIVETVPAARVEQLSQLLNRQGIDHNLLTGDDDERDAAVIAGAGRLGAITVVTQQAALGVEVVVGGGDGSGRDQVLQHGGLCVLGTERLSWHRDEHVRGRAGRQGDPGESRFICCRDDRNYRGVNPADLTRGVRYDAVLDEQRRLVYADRRHIVQSADVRHRIPRMIDEVIDTYVAGPSQIRGEDDLRPLWEKFGRLYPISLTTAEIIAGSGGAPPTRQDIAERVKADAHAAYHRRERDLGDDVMRVLERRVLLSVVDRAWRTHLIAVDQLQDGIVLRRYGKREPLTEYRREALEMFTSMTADVQELAVGYLFNLEVTVEETG